MKRDRLARVRQRTPPSRLPKGRIALGAGVVATLALVAAVVYWLQPRSAEAELAEALDGERWYAVVFGHKPIGHYRTINRRTEDGGFEFRTVLRFKLREGAETRIEDRLVFHSLAPHPLAVAVHTVETGAARSSIFIRGGVAELSDGDDIRRRPLDATLAMRDYLAVELWLAHGAPSLGEVGNARALDFDQLAVVTHRWRVLAHNENSVDLAKDGREHDALVRLDRSLTPAWMRIGELFELQRVADEETALAWQSALPLFAAASPSVAVDGVIEQPANLRRLVLAVEGDSGGSWPNTVTRDAGVLPPADRADVERARAVTLRYPGDDPHLRALAEQAVAGLDTAEDKADALTAFVYRFLDYRDVVRPRTVFDTLRDRHGDCTEFADLYTTLARAVGVPARTVVGLAYRAGSVPQEGAFALHAWNEVAIDGRWRSVDPTWGQTRLAATHLPLPADSVLAAIAALPRLRFRVLEARYGLPYDVGDASASGSRGES